MVLWLDAHVQRIDLIIVAEVPTAPSDLARLHAHRGSTTAACEQAEAQELIIACDCPQYLAKAEKRLAEEAQRVALYLDPTTEAKVVHVAETALIQQQVSATHPPVDCEASNMGVGQVKICMGSAEE